MTLSKLHITVFVVLAAGAWGLILLIRGTPVSMDHIVPFSLVTTFLGFVGLVFDHILWRQPWLHGWFVKRPDLRGTWRVEMKSDWTDPATGEESPIIVCYVGVVQTMFKLQMHLMTPESESWFIASNIQESQNGKGYQVSGIYINRPNIDLRGGQSDMHHGALILETHGPARRPDSLDGEYWTDRKTLGRIRFTGRSPKVETSFNDAERLFNSVIAE